MGHPDRIVAVGGRWTRRLCGRFKLGSIIPALWASLFSYSNMEQTASAARSWAKRSCSVSPVSQDQADVQPRQIAIARGLLASDLQMMATR